LIELKNLTKRYTLGDEIWELKDINLKIKQHSFTVITGMSGSGKSTLLHLLGGLDFPKSGKILVNKTDITKLQDAELSYYRNKTVGFIFQNFYLYPDINLVQNVALPLMIKGETLSIREEKAKKTLELVGLKGLEKHAINQISGGQRQRVAIARAMINNPDILLADEPTGNLDTITGKKIIELLENLQKNNHLTLVIVTHNEYIIKQAEQLITLKDGQILSNKTLIKT